MGKISMKGVCDMHVHTNPDLRLRAYDDFELADAAVRVGARAIVIKTHLGFTVNRAYLTNQYVKKVYGENTGFTMYGGVVMNKVIGGINPEAVEKGLKLGAKEIWLPTQSAKRHLEKMGQDPAKGIQSGIFCQFHYLRGRKGTVGSIGMNVQVNKTHGKTSFVFKLFFLFFL